MCEICVIMGIHFASQVWPWEMVSHFWNRNIMFLLILLGEVRCIAENTLCKLYVVKIWEGLI